MDSSAAMTRNVVIVSPRTTLDAAMRLMDSWNIRHLPVVEAGELVGMLSDRDVLRCAPRGPGTRCADAMTAAPLTCGPHTRIGRLAELMLERKIDSLPIVNAAGALVGLVTSSDLLALLVDREEAERALPFDFRLHLVSDGDLAAAAG